tara:strand:+ start:29935 stop:30330 length:396 start_codon:yes stop_codon:yes gene_type:complete
MYAIVQISGNQYRVEPGLVLTVPRQHVDEGGKVTYSDILLFDDGKKLKIGTPTVPNTTVEATIIEHGRGPKVIVFKKKRRKGYKKKNTHRQDYTKIEVKSIKAKATTKTSESKKTESGKTKSKEASTSKEE